MCVGTDGGFLVGEPLRPERLGLSDHSPGEFMVSYYSEEGMWAAPQENVVETSPVYYPYLSYGQLLYFEDIASIQEPCERFRRRGSQEAGGINLARREVRQLQHNNHRRPNGAAGVELRLCPMQSLG